MLTHVLETRLPYAPVIEMIDQVIRRFPAIAHPRRTGDLGAVSRHSWSGRGQRVAGIDRGLATTRLFAAGVVELLHEFGRSYSALVVVEDVHWADPATADMVAFVAGKLARTRMALVVTTRRDGRATDPRIAELLRLPSACSLVLDPLTDDAVTELLDQVSVPADSARARRVRAAAGGIPFFALHLALHGKNGSCPGSYAMCWPRRWSISMLTNVTSSCSSPFSATCRTSACSSTRPGCRWSGSIARSAAYGIAAP